jgi:hypothetical protein
MTPAIKLREAAMLRSADLPLARAVAFITIRASNILTMRWLPLWLPRLHGSR